MPRCNCCVKEIWICRGQMRRARAKSQAKFVGRSMFSSVFYSYNKRYGRQSRDNYGEGDMGNR